jgi:hypothetical protein
LKPVWNRREWLRSVGAFAAGTALSPSTLEHLLQEPKHLLITVQEAMESHPIGVRAEESRTQGTIVNVRS